MAVLPAAPTPGTISTPFMPGYGYGFAAAAGPAIQYANQLDLQKRQMDINEAAEQRANAYFSSIEGEMADRQKQRLADARSSADAYATLDGSGVPPTPTPQPPESYGVPGSTIPANYPLPPGSADAVPGRQVPSPSYGSPAAMVSSAKNITADASEKLPADATKISDDDISKLNTYQSIAGMGNKVVPVAAGGVKGGATGGSELRTPGFSQQGGGKGGYGAPVPAPDTGAGAGMTPQQILAMSEGKVTVAPTEGNGYIQKGTELKSQATAIQGRLDSALKMIDKQYSGDPTYAAYAKAGLIAKVAPQVSSMNAQADHLNNQGLIANHMQVGAQLGQQIIGELTNGRALDDKFIDAHRAQMSYLGIGASDLAMFKGIHMSDGVTNGGDRYNKGFIVNAGGFIIPPKALWDAANYALPYQARADAWSGWVGMYKDQLAARARIMEAANSDPLMAVKWAIGADTKVNAQYSDAAQKYAAARNVVTKGGDWQTTLNGKPQTVKIPPMPDVTKAGEYWGRVADSVYNADATVPPVVTQYYKQYLKPLEDLKDSLSSTSAYLKQFTKAGPNARKTPEEISAEEGARQEAIGDKDIRVKRVAALTGKLKRTPDEEKELQGLIK